MVIRASELGQVDTIPTGLIIDEATGIGGLPKGCITEIYGDEGIGKSTLCLQIVARAQKRGLKCLWVDTEWCFTYKYAESLGVNNDELLLIREKCAEDILDAIVEEVEGDEKTGVGGDYGLVVIDSIGGLTPRAELEKTTGEKVIGGQAAVVAKFCRKITPILSIQNTSLIVINHSVIDFMSGKYPKHITSGGKKLAYHKALSVRLSSPSKSKYIIRGTKVLGRNMCLEVMKNKHAGNERAKYFGELLFGEGFSTEADLFNIALAKGVITKEGNSYFFAGQKIGVGQPKAKEALKGEELFKKVQTACDIHPL